MPQAKFLQLLIREQICFAVTASCSPDVEFVI